MTGFVEKKAWVLTDGKAGDENQCLGVVEALGWQAELRHVAPRAPFAWLMPYGPIDPKDASRYPHSPIAPPFPALVVASGRRAVPYVKAIKAAAGDGCLTVFLKDPRTGVGAADLIWVSEHDRLRGANVLTSLTAPHRMSSARLEEARQNPDPRLTAFFAQEAKRLKVAVLVGGKSRHHWFTDKTIERFITALQMLADLGVVLMITTSRRTPEKLKEALKTLSRDTAGFYWDGEGENPYLALLALADNVVVTADSTNMIGEACASGVPVLVFSPEGGHSKLHSFLMKLDQQGITHPFTGHLVSGGYTPVDSTPDIALAIAQALRARGMVF